MFGHKKYFFDTIRKYTVYFGTVFNEIYIGRSDNNGTELQVIKVPIMYGPKNPQLVRTDADPTITREAATVLPRMSFKYEGFGYDANRKISSPRQIIRKNNNDLNKVKMQYTPVPYDISFSLHIHTNNIEDGHKIVEQIVPFFTPDYTATVNLIPEMDISMDIPLILESIDSEDIYEGEFTTTRRGVIWTLGFKMKAWFFGPIVDKPLIKLSKTQYFFGSPETTNTIVSRVTVRPGMDANGNPTSNAAITVPFANIAIDDTFGYIINISDNFDSIYFDKIDSDDDLNSGGNVLIFGDININEELDAILTTALNPVDATFNKTNNDDIVSSSGSVIYIPSSVFTVDSVGAWYDASDPTSMFTGRGNNIAPGENPSVGDPAGIIFDKSRLGGKTVPEHFAAADNLIDGSGWYTDGTGTSFTNVDGVITLINADETGAYPAVRHPFAAETGKTYLVYAETLVPTGSTNGVYVLRDPANVTDITAAGVVKDTWVGHWKVWKKSTADSTPVISFGNFTADATASDSISVRNIKVIELPGTHMFLATDVARPILRQDGNSNYYLEGNKTTTQMQAAIPPTNFTDSTVMTAIEYSANSLLGVYEDITFRHSHEGQDTLNNANYDVGSSLGNNKYLFVSTPPGTIRVATSVFDQATSVRVRLDGTESYNESTAIDTGMDAATTIFMGDLTVFGSSGGNFPSRLYSMIVIDKSLSIDEITDLETYMADRSGVTLS